MPRKKFIYTNKTHPMRGMSSTILGIISVGTYIYGIYGSYRASGNISDRFGAAILLAVLFSVVGFILGIFSLTEKDTFKIFPILGIVLNVIAFALLSAILYAGAYAV